MDYSQQVIDTLLSNLKFDNNGLIPSIAQDHKTKDVLMMAWMSKDSIVETFKCGYAVYWSRSRKTLWRKGETSGHLSKIVHFRYDCDSDTILLLVDQHGPACHTMRNNCFYYQLSSNKIDIISRPI